MDTDASRLLHYLSRAHHQMQGAIQREVAKTNGAVQIHAGMRPIFCALAQEDHLTVSDLVGKLRLAKSTVTGTVRRMERAGLVELRPDGDDRRRRRVALTAKGREIVPNCERIEAGIDSHLNSFLNPGELRELIRLLVKLAPGWFVCFPCLGCF